VRSPILIITERIDVGEDNAKRISALGTGLATCHFAVGDELLYKFLTGFFGSSEEHDIILNGMVLIFATDSTKLGFLTEANFF
jgi:hypothetical protein